MRQLFVSSSSNENHGFMMCHCGASSIDDKDYEVTTNYLKADEVPEECLDAKTFSELVARLLNEYFDRNNKQNG